MEKNKEQYKVCYAKVDGFFSLTSVTYAYADTRDNLSTRILNRTGISIKPMFYYDPMKDSPYRLVFCKVKKRAAARFVEALREMPRTAYLLGYDGYEQKADELFSLLRSTAVN